MNSDQKLWNKPVNDLTVGDAMKINGIAMAVFVGPFAFFVVKDVVKGKLQQHKNRKQNKIKEEN